MIPNIVPEVIFLPEGKVKAIFCYRVSALAGMAYDENGQDVECYIKFSMTDNNDMPVNVSCEFYCKKHFSAIQGLAKTGGLKPEWIEPITQEEYLEVME